MSESSLSDTTPDKVLERALRHAVQAVYRSGDMAELTVKRIRKAAEEALRLHDGFFKKEDWKDRSKSVIEDEVEVQANAAPASSQPELPKASRKPAEKPKPVSKSQNKRPSPNGSKSTKRRKISKGHDSEDEKPAVESEAEPKNQSRKVEAKQRQPSKEHASVAKADGSDEDEIDKAEASIKPSIEVPPAVKSSESEMSEVLDDTPKKPKSRKRRSDSGEPKPKTGNKKETQKSRKLPQDTDPDTDEIKRLQGWLAKCGIRKMWHKELAPFDTPKAKIRHLKKMLSDAGMTGRYSAEKATEIREARELKADLEAVQAGNRVWGKEESEEEEGTVRPRRRLAKGLQSLDFLNDDDGEETD